MASPILRLNAEVASQDGRNRLTIYFSHLAPAKDYSDYLQTLDASWNRMVKQEEEAGKEVGHEGEKEGKTADFQVHRAGKVVSINLPSSVIPLNENDGKDVALNFKSEAEARVWNRKMLLWTGYPENKQTLSRSLTVQALNEALGLSNQNNQNLINTTNIFWPPTTQSVGPPKVFHKLFGAKRTKSSSRAN